MSFSSSVSDEVLVKCGRRCCICHVFCGTKMELHHIKQHSVTEFSNLVAQETFPKSSELSSVPEEWEIDQPERFWKAVENLGAFATNVWNDYCDLVKLARRKLLV